MEALLLYSVGPPLARMYDAIREDNEAYKFRMMFCDISFPSCCKWDSRLAKLVGCLTSSTKPSKIYSIGDKSGDRES
ncbi:hypothetical protein TNCV_197291 [Trichonephila clavipes]|nr:hypothetical protein TNCV_197291 [Trichonephila clavipes]